MKNICLKTEDPGKYLSVYLLDEDWFAVLTSKGLLLTNDTTNQIYDVLDITEDNADVFLVTQNSPLDWASRTYYYYPEVDVWEYIPAVEEPAIDITE